MRCMFVADALGLSAFTRVLLAGFVILQRAIWTTFSTTRAILHIVIVDAESFIDFGTESTVVVNSVAG